MTVCGKIFSALTALTLLTIPLQAEIKGKVDAGIARVKVETIQSGSTVQRYHLLGFSANATVVPWNWVCIKPKVLYASGSGGDLWNIGSTVGAVVPVSNCFYLFPSLGLSFGSLETQADLLIPVAPFLVPNQAQEVSSRTPSIGLDFSYTINDIWVVSGGWHYGWSRAHTTISNLVDEKTESRGSNYALQLDYYFGCDWSANIGYAHNTSLSKEKHGLEISGWRLGAGYTF